MSFLRFGLEPVRIGDRQPAENLALGAHHLECVFLPFVVVAKKMQETVHGKVGDMMGKRLAFAARLPDDGFMGQNDIAEIAGSAVFCLE